MYGDFNKDKEKDVLEYYYNNGSPSIKILLKSHKIFSRNIGFSTEEYYMPILYKKPGYIIINESYGSRYDNDYIYKWIEDDWYLFGIFHKIEGDGIVNSYLEKVNLSKTEKLGDSEFVNIQNKNFTEYQFLFEKTYNQYLDAYKKKDFEILKNHDQFLTLNLLNHTELNNNSVQKFNDIAFFIQSIPNCDYHLLQESINILLYIIKEFPNRTVAYINLGDAYWGLEEKDNASHAYQKYIELMKASGKECKIPKRVFERIK